MAVGFNERGGSHVEPEDPKLFRPKLFGRERDAKGWLTMWLKGKQTLHSYQTYEGEYDISFETTPVETRKRDEMEIVPVHIYIPDNT